MTSATIITLPVIFGRNQNIARTSSATIILPPAFAPRAHPTAEQMERPCTHDDALAYANSKLAGDA